MMPGLLEKALSAKRESKHIEFKHSFDPTSMGEWCEVINDIVAIANSGGGIIVFGLETRRCTMWTFKSVSQTAAVSNAAE